MGLFEFMTGSPVLTCFILLIIGMSIEAAIRAFKGTKDE